MVLSIFVSQKDVLVQYCKFQTKSSAIKGMEHPNFSTLLCEMQICILAIVPCKLHCKQASKSLQTQIHQYNLFVLSLSLPRYERCFIQTITLKPCPNGKCLVIKCVQTFFGDQTFSRLDTLFGVVGSCLIMFDHVWLCLIKFERRQTFD